MADNAAGFLDAWRIANARRIADTPAGVVYDAALADGGRTVVKALKPEHFADNARGMDFLDWRDGVGAIRLLDRSDTLFLLEHAGIKTLRDVLETNGDRRATEIAAQVLVACHAPSGISPPATLQPLDRYFRSLFLKVEADRRDGIDSVFIEAATVADELLAQQQDIKPLHGDLHHENIMWGPRGWLVIDPVGLIGDPALDVANMFSNPLDRHDLTRDEERAGWMAALFAETLHRDPRTILRYAFAYGCLSAAWHEEDGNAKDRDDELAVVATIRRVLAQF